jgi:hypothetical protein
MSTKFRLVFLRPRYNLARVIFTVSLLFPAKLRGGKVENVLYFKHRQFSREHGGSDEADSNSGNGLGGSGFCGLCTVGRLMPSRLIAFYLVAVSVIVAGAVDWFITR